MILKNLKIHLSIKFAQPTSIFLAGVLTKLPGFEIVCVSAATPIVKRTTRTQSGVVVPSRTDPSAVSGSWWETAWISYRACR